MTVFNFPDTSGKPTDGTFTWTAPNGLLYSWDGDAWRTIGGGGDGNASITITDDLTTIPAPDAGDLAWHTIEARMYIYYQDDDSQQWVDASPAGDDGINDAPSDGKLYGRQDGEWEEVTGGGGGVSGSGADAWGKFDGTGANGNLTVDNSFNVASINKTGTGTYAVTFTTPMPSSNYAVTATSSGPNCQVSDLTETGFKIENTNGSNVLTDARTISFTVFASNAIAPEAGLGADAWGLFASADGALVNGFNFGSATKTTTGRYTVPFITAMPNASYAAVATPASGSARINATLNQTETQIEVWIRDQNGSSIDSSFSLVVHASSTITPTYTWTRTGTTLEPANAGDDVDLGTGDLSAAAGTFSGNVLTAVTDNLGPGSTELRPNGSIKNRHDGSIDTTYTYALYSGGNDPGDLSLLLRSNGQVEIGGSLSASRGLSSPNITLNSSGNIQAGGGYFNIANESNSQILTWTTGHLKYRVGVSAGAGKPASGPAIVNAGDTTWGSFSDERMKTNLQPIADGLNKISGLRAVTGRYTWDEDSKDRAFLIAQDVEKVLPQAVTEDEEGYHLRYTEVIPLLVSALHDAKARIEALEAEVQALKGGN